MADAEDEMDCRAVVEELYTFLDGELTQTRRLQIEQHYTGCPDCHEVIAFHTELKFMIAQKCREPVPESLRVRIANALGLGDPGIPGR